MNCNRISRYYIVDLLKFWYTTDLLQSLINAADFTPKSSEIADPSARLAITFRVGIFTKKTYVSKPLLPQCQLFQQVQLSEQ